MSAPGWDAFDRTLVRPNNTSHLECFFLAPDGGEDVRRTGEGVAIF